MHSALDRLAFAGRSKMDQPYGLFVCAPFRSSDSGDGNSDIGPGSF